MVRRWSHINQINQYFYENSWTNIKPILNVYRLLIFKTTTYYWEELYFDNLTYIKRRSYIRRKHLSILVYYQIILNFWSKDYLFIRRYSRALLNISLHKYNYVTQNLFTFTSLGADSLLGYEYYVMTSFTRILSKFVSTAQGSLYFGWLNYTKLRLIVSSTEKIHVLFNEEPLLPCIKSQSFNSNRIANAYNIRSIFINLLLNILIFFHLQFYNLLILVVSYNLFLFCFCRKLLLAQVPLEITSS